MSEGKEQEQPEPKKRNQKSKQPLKMLSTKDEKKSQKQYEEEDQMAEKVFHKQNQTLFQKLLEENPNLESSSELKPLSAQCEIEKYIFNQKKRGSIFKKISNTPKHYIRQFLNNSEQFEAIYDKKEKIHLNKIKAKLNKKLKDKDAIIRSDVNYLLGKNQKNELRKKNRYIMRQILLKDQCGNINSQNKLSYMIACKIFALRCMKEELILRNVSI